MGSKSSSSVFNYTARQLVTGVESFAPHSYTLNKERIGNELPNHKALIKNKDNATTVLDAYEMSILKFQLGFYTGHDFSDPFWTLRPPIFSSNFGCSLELPSFNLADFTGLDDTAVAHATSKAFQIIQNKQSPFQGQVFLGELKETIELLRHPLEKSLNLTKALVGKVSRKGTKRLIKSTSESWLEFRFGILPLISDVKSIVQLVQAKADQDEVLSYRTYGVEESVDTQMYDTSDIYGFKCRVADTNWRKSEHIIRFGLLQRVIDEHETIANKLIGSIDQMSSVPATLWEITPWSFLIDYFVNVQDLITAGTTSTQSVSYTSRSQIRTHIRTKYIYDCYAYVGDHQVVDFAPSVFSAQYREVHRVGAQLGIPPLVFHLPGSNMRYANIAALAANLIK